MKAAFFCFLFLFSSLQLLGAKTYELKIEVIGRGSNSPIENAKIFTLINNVKTEVGTTNKKGEFTMSDLTEKEFTIEVISQNENYRNNTIYYNNSKRSNDKIVIYLSQTYFQEKIADKQMDDKYDGSFEVAEYEKDTVNFVMSEPVGGYNALMKFISENLRYPEESLEKGETGRVMIAFIVQADGQITHVTIKKGVSIYLDDEAIRVVRKFPKWTPATYKGQAVRSHILIPLNFSLN